MNDRKLIGIRLPHDLLRIYEEQATKEGHGTLSGWIIAVLNERVGLANKLLTNSKQSFSKPQARKVA